jgi:HAD superfamily hydrolase (TIGR01490 family)
MIHIFDVDYTIIKKPSAWYFLREAMSVGAIHFSQVSSLPFEWFRYKIGFPNQDFIEEAIKHIAGMEQGMLEEIAETCFERRIKPNIYAGMAEIIGETLKKGEQALFATSSFNIIIKPLERFFGISGSIASSLEFNDMKATGKLSGGSCFGIKKKDAVENWLKERCLQPQEVRFYSDSYTDIPLLEFCGQAVAVNPDRFLARKARKHGWDILRFREILNN